MLHVRNIWVIIFVYIVMCRVIGTKIIKYEFEPSSDYKSDFLIVSFHCLIN